MNQVVAVVKRGIEVNQRAPAFGCNLTDFLAYFVAPHARAAPETPVARQQWRQIGDIDFHIGVNLAQGVDEAQIVGLERAVEVGPVARVGVVDAQMHYGHIGAERFGALPFLRGHVGVMSVVEKRRSGTSEVSHLIAIAEKQGELGRIGISGRIGES